MDRSEQERLWMLFTQKHLALSPQPESSLIFNAETQRRRGAEILEILSAEIFSHE